MSRFRLNKIKFLGLAACAAFIAVVAFGMYGCGDYQTSPDPASQYRAGTVIENPNFTVIYPEKPGGPVIQTSTEARKVISATLGGQLTNGRVQLDFPPGALDVDTEIRLQMDDTGLFITDLGPDGIVFNLPVIMTFDLLGTSNEGLAASTYIAWYNPTTGQWEMIENLPPLDANHNRGNVYHFTKYSSIGG